VIQSSNCQADSWKKTVEYTFRRTIGFILKPPVDEADENKRIRIVVKLSATVHTIQTANTLQLYQTRVFIIA